MIYIVTSGSYSDYQIEGVFDNEELAKKYASYIENSEVEEHALNPDYPYAGKLDSGLKCFTVALDKNGEINNIYEYGYKDDYFILYDGNDAYAVTWARDKKHAVKIVAEKYAQALYERNTR